MVTLRLGLLHDGVECLAHLFRQVGFLGGIVVFPERGQGVALLVRSLWLLIFRMGVDHHKCGTDRDGENQDKNQVEHIAFHHDYGFMIQNRLHFKNLATQGPRKLPREDKYFPQ